MSPNQAESIDQKKLMDFAKLLIFFLPKGLCNAPLFTNAPPVFPPFFMKNGPSHENIQIALDWAYFRLLIHHLAGQSPELKSQRLRWFEVGNQAEVNQ